MPKEFISDRELLEGDIHFDAPEQPAPKSTPNSRIAQKAPGSLFARVLASLAQRRPGYQLEAPAPQEPAPGEVNGESGPITPMAAPDTNLKTDISLNRITSAAERFMAGLTSGAMSLEGSAMRIPETIGRVAEAGLEGVGVKPEVSRPYNILDPKTGLLTRGFNVGDFHVGGFSDLADQFHLANTLLPQLHQAFRDNDQSNQQLDEGTKELFDYVGSNFKTKAPSKLRNAIFNPSVLLDAAVQGGADLGSVVANAISEGKADKVKDVMADPGAWASALGQAIPSLAAALASGGSLKVMGLMEGLEFSDNAAQFEKETGVRIDAKEFTTGFLQQAAINGYMEKIGFDESFKMLKAGTRHLSKALAVMAKQGIKASTTEGITEGLQSLNGNLATRFSYNQKQDIWAGFLASVMGGVAAGGGASVSTNAIGYINRTAEVIHRYDKMQLAQGKPPINPIDRIKQSINQKVQEQQNRLEDLKLDLHEPRFKRSEPSQVGQSISALAKTPVTKYKSIVFGQPTQMVVDAAKKLGVDVSGYSHKVDNYAVRHALKQHGKDEFPITEEDLALIPDIVQTPDRIDASSKKTGSGESALVYVKRYNGTTVYVEVVRSDKKSLKMKTMYKKKSPGLEVMPKPTSNVLNAVPGDKPNIPQNELNIKPDQTQTLAFKSWFGASKVVDGRGKPKVVYHYSRSEKDFSVFGKGIERGSEPGNINTLGAHFGSAEQARGVKEILSPGDISSGERTYPVYLSIKNPMRTKDGGDWAPLIKEAKAKGHDGIIYQNRFEGKGYSYIAFYPTQIKSATGNRSTFDPKNPDIRYKVADTFFSHLERTIQDKMPNSASPDQVRGILKNSGVKQEQIDEVDIESFLDGKDKVSKQDLLDYIRSHDVKVEEVVKGAPGPSRLIDYRDELGGEPRQITDEKEFEMVSGETLDDGEIGLLYPNGLWLKQLKGGDFLAIAGSNSEVFDDLREAEQFIVEKFAMSEGLTKSENLPKFSNYQLPGGENYKELLLTLPTERRQTAGVKVEKLPQGNQWYITDGPTKGGLVYADSEREALKLAGYKKDAESQQFKSSHFDEPNVLAHVRFNERTDADGKKVLFIEEIQSDWHQKGRKEGYQNGKLSEEEQRFLELDKEAENGKSTKEYDRLYDKLYSHYSPDMPEGNDSLKDFILSKKSGVPNAPFKKTWHELSLKRMLRYAAENGFDKIAWTTGEQQAERYDLSKQIDAVHVRPANTKAQDKINELRKQIDQLKSDNESGQYDDAITRTGDEINLLKQDIGKSDEVLLTAIKDNKIVIPSGANSLRISRDKLEDYVGKDIAKKALEAIDKTGEATSLSGLDLKVGGEGMKGFYDQIIPSFLNKYTKKWGGRVGLTSLDMGKTKGGYDRMYADSPGELSSVHSLELTPSMKASVMEGQPLFRRPTMDELKYGLSEEEIARRSKGGMEFLKKYLPEIAHAVQNPFSLSTIFGQNILGDYLDGTIRVRKDQPLPIYKHEGGHAFFDLFLSDGTKIKLLDAIRRQYKERVNQYAEQFKVSQDRAAEEILMELAEKVDEKDYTYQGKPIHTQIVLLLKRALRNIRAFFNSDKAQIEKFFNAFYTKEREVITPPGFRNALQPRYKIDEEDQAYGDEDLTPEDQAFMDELAKSEEAPATPPQEFFTDEEMQQARDIQDAEEAIAHFSAVKEFMDSVGKFKRFKGNFLREELSTIKKSFFTTDPNAETLDEVADRLEVSTSDLITQLQDISKKWNHDLRAFRSGKKTIEQFFSDQAMKQKIGASIVRRTSQILQKDFKRFKSVIQATTGIKDRSAKLNISEKNALKVKMQAKVQAAKWGFREGVRNTREKFLTAMAEAESNLKSKRFALQQYIAKQNELGNVQPGLLRPLMNMANKVNTDGELVRAFARVDQIIQKGQKQEVISQIKSIIRKSDTAKTIAVEYKELIQAVEDEILLRGKRQDTINKLRKTEAWIKREIAAGRNVDIPKRIYDALRGLDRIPLRDYELNDLYTLYDKLDTLFSLGQMKYQNRRSAFIAERGQLEQELLNSKAVKIEARELKTEPIRGRLSAKDSGINLFRSTMNKLQAIDLNLSPMDVIYDMFDGGAGYAGPWHRIFKRSNDVAFSNFLRETWQFKDDLAAIEKRLALKRDNYRAVGIWAALQQDDGMEKLLNNGYSEKEILAVKLNPKEMEYYEFLRQSLDALKPRLKDLMATVHNQEFGEVKNYFPFLTDFNILNELESAQRIFDTAERKALQREPGMGFTKERVGAGKQKIKINAHDVYLNHIENALYALHMDYNLKMLAGVMDSQEIQNKLGDRGTTIIKQWLDVMARKGGVTGQQQIRALDIMRHNYGMVTLGFKLSSAMIQPTALFDGAALIGDYAFRGSYAIATNPGMRKVVSQMPEIRERVGDDPAFSEKTGFKALDDLQSVGMKPLKALDGITAASIAAGAYQQYLDKHKIQFDPNNVNQDALQYAQLIVRRSQSSSMFKDTPLAISRGKIGERFENRSVARLFTQFQTFMLNRWSWIRHDFPDDIKNHRWGAVANKVIYLNMALVTEVMLRNLSRDIIRAVFGGGDDKDKEFADQYIMNAIQTVPFVSQAVGSAYYNSIPLPLLQFIARNFQNLSNYQHSKKPATKAKWAKITAIEGIGGAVGIPGTMQLSQILRNQKAGKNYGY